MRNPLCFILFFFSGLSFVSAQEPDLPPELLKGADAVILKEETVVRVEKLNKVIAQKHLRIAILNRQGEALFETFSAYYDSFKKIRKIEAAAYRPDGTLLVKSKNADVRDVALNSFDLSVTDARVRSISLDKKRLTVPYILEFILEEESSETFFYDDWAPVSFLRTSVAESIYRLITPPDITYRTREINLGTSSAERGNDGWKTETWKLENYPAITSERYIPPNSIPRVFIEPGQYRIDKYSGTVSSWNDIGDFYRQLNRGRDALPQHTKDKLKEVLGTETDTLGKARLVYRFMQNHTRYFNVSFRLGGWQSLPASLVAEKGYGDCKALTNYTLALLKEAGVKAYPALVNSGIRADYTELDDFPKNSFDHIIACIPTAKDTVWLECTSQTNPFGYLGSFTGNRKALLIGDHDAKLVDTRSYGPEENSVWTSAHIRLQQDGTAEVRYQAAYDGIRQEEAYGLALSKDREKQKRWLTAKSGVSDIALNDFGFEISDRGVIETVTLKAPALGNISGGRLFFRHYLQHPAFSSERGSEPEERYGEFYLNPNHFSFTDRDTVTVTLPAGYLPESQPRDVKLETPFGYYESKVLRGKPGELQYIRHLQVRGGHYARETYGEWVKFTEAVNRADRQRTVLKKE